MAMPFGDDYLVVYRSGSGGGRGGEVFDHLYGMLQSKGWEFTLVLEENDNWRTLSKDDDFALAQTGNNTPQNSKEGKG